MKKTALYEPALGDQIDEVRAILTALQELTTFLLSDEYPNEKPFKETSFGVHLIFSDLWERLTKILEGLEDEDNAKEREEA